MAESIKSLKESFAELQQMATRRKPVKLYINFIDADGTHAGTYRYDDNGNGDRLVRVRTRRRIDLESD